VRSVQSHLDHPALGNPPVEQADADGCAGGSCGVLASYWLDVDEHGVIQSCSARVRGRASAFATASALCEEARGRSIIDAAKLGISSLHPSFAAFDDADMERALVAEDGFHHALGRWLLERTRVNPGATGSERPNIEPVLAAQYRPHAIVGMSGGVDSAVTLYRMQEDAGAGRDVIGVTLRLWIDPRAPDPEAACCSPDSVRRARATCHAAGLGHLSIDLRESFARAVVMPFVAEYAIGQTPNPCVRCNGRFRLDELVRIADALGAESVATGHYARIVAGRDGVHRIARGVDTTKDQSYMLAQVEPATTRRLRFPLGESDKATTRARASALGLEQATTPESQEVCFLGGGDYRTFLERGKALGKPGRIVLDDGDRTQLGTHDGIARFTPGQRRGIGVAHEHPLYVLDVNPVSGDVLVGGADRLEQQSIDLIDVNVHGDELPDRIYVQLRYRARLGAVPARIRHYDAEQRIATVELEVAERGPAPGQVAVLYDDEQTVVGAARIARACSDDTESPR
jgi:tRNA-specific 2-thiouridylase